MTRDDFVKQIENAEALLELIQAKTNLHIWDMAYAAGAKDKTLKPLTYEQIAELNLSAVTTTDAVNDVRAIELAHGIGVKND
jgi:hypothetical protein